MRAFLVTVVGSLLLTGCGAPAGGGGGGATPAPGTPAATASVAGDWTLVHQLNSSVGPGTPTSVTGALRLVQSGSSVAGTYSLDRPSTAVVVSGTVSGRNLTLQIGPVTLSGGATLSLADTMVVGTNEASGSTLARATFGASTLTTPGTCTMTRR